MKNAFVLALIAVSMMSQTQEAAAKASALPECVEPVAACEAAGYKPGDHKKTGKGLWVDCIAARAHDKAVEGVTITKEAAKACADAHKSHRAMKK